MHAGLVCIFAADRSPAPSFAALAFSRSLCLLYCPFRLAGLFKAAELLAAPGCFGTPALDALLAVAPGDSTATAHAGDPSRGRGSSAGGGFGRVGEVGDVSGAQGDQGLGSTERFYTSRCGVFKADPNRLVQKSLYVFMVAHWRRTLPRGQVEVVASEDFSDRGKAQRSLDALTDFAGLCRFRFDPKLLETPANVNRRGIGRRGGAGGDERPRHGARSAVIAAPDNTTATALTLFFEPYNAALAVLMGRDFGHWARLPDKKKADGVLNS